MESRAAVCTFGESALFHPAAGAVQAEAAAPRPFYYDRYGNVAKSGSGAFAGEYDEWNHLVADGGYPVYYDGAGNLTWDVNVSPSGNVFDGENQAVVLNGVEATYNAFGKPSSSAPGGGAPTYFVYDPEGEKIGEVANNTIARADLPLPGGEEAVYTAGGLSYYRHADWLGSGRLTTVASGAGVYASQAYAPFGELYDQTGGGNDVSFTGKHPDTVPNFDDFGAREYNPAMGRFLTPDGDGGNAAVPFANLQDPQTLNLYAYAGNNPVTNVDKDGHIFGLDDLAGIVIGGVVGAAVEVGKDWATGQQITTGSIVAATVGGAVLGEGTANALETGGASLAAAAAGKGAVEGFVLNSIQQGTDMATGEQHGYSVKSALVSTAAGALSAGVASQVPGIAVPGVSSGRGNMKAVAQGVATKIENGTASSMSLSTAVGGAIGSQVATSGRTVTQAAAEGAATKACNAASGGGCN